METIEDMPNPIEMIIGVTIIVVSFFFFIYLSTKVADYHYRTYKGHQPLYLIYGGIFSLIWYSVMVFIILHLPIFFKVNLI